MAMPRGFFKSHGQDSCLKVVKSLYGSKFTPRNWYMHLRSALLALGFWECKVDKCLFFQRNMLLILYVDDAGIVAPEQKHTLDFVEELQEMGFDLDIEGEFSSYLGIGIGEQPNGS